MDALVVGPALAASLTIGLLTGKLALQAIFKWMAR
jgi:hypothetical protein